MKLPILNKNKNSPAFSLLESLLACFISSIIALACLKLSSLSIKNKLQSSREVANLILYKKAEEILLKIQNDFQKQPLNIEPKINSGNIEFSDGSLFKLSASSKINPASFAISFLDLQFEGLALVKNYQYSAGYYNLEICQILSKKAYYDKELRQVVTANINSLYEFQVLSLEKLTYNEYPCYLLRLKNIKSIVLKTRTESIIKPINFIIPNTASYTYYLDEHKILRFLSTTGEEIRENQPLVEGVEVLNFDYNPKILTLAVSFARNKPSVYKNLSFIKKDINNLWLNLYTKLE